MRGDVGIAPYEDVCKQKDNPQFKTISLPEILLVVQNNILFPFFTN